MPLTLSSDLKTEPCEGEQPSADPDLDLLADVHNAKCMGSLRYQVLGLQTAIDAYNLKLQKIKD